MQLGEEGDLGRRGRGASLIGHQIKLLASFHEPPLVRVRFGIRVYVKPFCSAEKKNLWGSELIRAHQIANQISIEMAKIF